MFLFYDDVRQEQITIAEKKITRLFDAYEKKALAIIREEFMARVKPWLIYHNYYFRAGNGTWGIFNSKNKKLVDERKIPRRIINFLEGEFRGQSTNIGANCPDFPEVRRI